jgi:hypothetical protein
MTFIKLAANHHQEFRPGERLPYSINEYDNPPGTTFDLTTHFGL